MLAKIRSKDFLIKNALAELSILKSNISSYNKGHKNIDYNCINHRIMNIREQLIKAINLDPSGEKS